jgi:hypothetical protein
MSELRGSGGIMPEEALQYAFQHPFEPMRDPL